MLNERSINNITQQGYSAMRKEKARVYEVSKSLEHVTSSNNSIPLYLLTIKLSHGSDVGDFVSRHQFRPIDMPEGIRVGPVDDLLLDEITALGHDQAVSLPAIENLLLERLAQFEVGFERFVTSGRFDRVFVGPGRGDLDGRTFFVGKSALHEADPCGRVSA